MLREVLFRDDQKLTTTDLNNLGLFPRQTFDALVEDAISQLRYFTGFTVTKTGQTEITISPGRYWAGGPVFVKSDPTVQNLLTGGNYMPVVTRRKIAIVTYGEPIETDVEERSFIIDDAGNTEPQSVPMERLRAARVALVAGAESPDPQKPTLDVGVIPVGWITLTTSGVLDGSIEMAEDYRLPSVESLKQKIADLQAWRALTGQILDTIQTELAKVQASMPPDLSALMLEVLRRLDELERLIKRPASAVKEFVDAFISLRETDEEYSGYDAKVDGGLKFPGGTPEYQEIVLNNALDPKIKNTNNILSPAMSGTKARVVIDNPDGQLSISQYTTQETVRVQKTMSRTVYEYQTAFSINANGVRFPSKNLTAMFGSKVNPADLTGWLEKLYDQIVVQDALALKSRTFKFRGPEGSELDVTFNPQSDSGTYGVVVVGGKVSTVSEPYWEEITRDATVTGSQVAQTFLNATNGLMTAVGLRFGQVALSGDVKVFICETEGGKPVAGSVISKGTIAAANLNTNAEVLCQIEPVQLLGGRMYAVVVVTTGNHFLRVRSGDKYRYGSAYYLSDTAEWLPVQNSGDICLGLYFPAFEQTRVEVLMQPLTRAGGIASIRINAAQIVPSGTKLVWEVQRAGKWYQISEGEYGALTGAPTLVNLRAVFIGTRDLMPSIDMSQTEVELLGADDTFTHISTVLTCSATTSVQVHAYITGWDPDEHEIDIDLILPGSPDTVESADSLTITPDPHDATTVKVVAVFTPTSTTAFRVKITGDKGESDAEFVVNERRAFAF